MYTRLILVALLCNVAPTLHAADERFSKHSYDKEATKALRSIYSLSRGYDWPTTREKMMTLLEQNGNPNVEKRVIGSCTGDKPLITEACEHDDLPMLARLTAHGARVNVGNDFQIPLCVARSPQVVRHLVEHKANVDYRNYLGQSPLHIAAIEYSSGATLKELCDHFSVNEQDTHQGATPLLELITINSGKAGFLGRVSIFLESIPDLEMEDYGGRSARTVMQEFCPGLAQQIAGMTRAEIKAHALASVLESPEGQRLHALDEYVETHLREPNIRKTVVQYAGSLTPEPEFHLSSYMNPKKEASPEDDTPPAT